MAESEDGSAEVFDRWLEQAREEGVEDDVLNKRASPRIAWTVYVEVLGDAAEGERITGRTRDISEGGIGLQCRKPIPDRTVVRVYRQDQGDPAEYVEGRVMHSTMTIGGYKVGIRVNP